MKNFVQAISEAEQFPKQKEKFAALSGMDDLSLRLVEEALNPFRVFNVRKWPTPFHTQQDASYQIFLDMLDKLHNREVTGNEARDLVSKTLSYYTDKTSKYLERVLGKDLKCGASETTFEKLYPNFSIPKFDLMLCGKVDKKYVWSFPCLLEQKLDGNRLLAQVTDDEVIYFTRSGKKSYYCAGLFDEELFKMAKEIGEPIVVDGEALASSFQETCQAKGESNLEAKKSLRFYAFDIMTLAEWNKQECLVTQDGRSSNLEKLINKLDLVKIIKSKYKYVYNLTEAKDFYEEILKLGINDDGTINGLGEGLIVKDPKGLYSWKRSKAWMKWKSIITVDLKIIEICNGKKDSKYEDILGALKVEGYDENGNFITSYVGSGFLDEQRIEIWKNKDSYLGNTIEIEAQEITITDSGYSLRFPVFSKFRPDKD